jgi:hypothetical protein
VTYNYLPSNLPTLLRDAGLEVEEIDGWRTRGRPASTGDFAPVGVLNHHTGASANGWTLAREMAYAIWMFITGRPPSLPAPLCQIALGRSGTVYLGAAGRANHAGTAKASGSVAAGDGNSLYIGIEWMLSGTEKIPRKMKKAGILLNAVLTQEITDDGKGTSVETISCHYNTSVSGKWDIGDPNGVPYADKKVLDIEKFRGQVARKRTALNKKRKKAKIRKALRLTVALINVPVKVGAASWEACFRLAAKSPIFGLNESSTRRQRELYAALSEKIGFSHSGLRNCTNPIFWDADRFTKLFSEVHEIHPAGTGPLADKYPGFNAARTINEVVLADSAGHEFAVLCTHFVPNGVKVNSAWRDKVRKESKRALRKLAQEHREAGRKVVVMGDMNMYEPFRLGKGIRWYRKFGIDKIGGTGKGSAKTFKAPTDHKRGVRATLKH